MEKQITEMEVTNKLNMDNFAKYDFKVAKPTKFKGENAVFHYKVTWVFDYSRFVPKFVDQYAEITLESGKVAWTRVHMKRDTKKFNNLVWSFHKARKAS
tara:strand:+ start:169 stop:465 length:297 start_codon:yes stop_codon:yes gene_type:complete